MHRHIDIHRHMKILSPRPLVQALNTRLQAHRKDLSDKAFTQKLTHPIQSRRQTWVSAQDCSQWQAAFAFSAREATECS